MKAFATLLPYYHRLIFGFKSLSFDIDSQLEYMDMLNSYMVSGQYKTKDAVFKVRSSYLEIYGKDHIAVQISDEIIASLNIGGSYVAVIKAHFSANIAIGYELSQLASANKASINEITNLVKIERAISKEALATLLQPGVMALLAIVANAAIGRYMLPALDASNNNAAQPSIEHIIAVALGYIVFDGWFIVLLMLAAMIAGYSYLQHNLTGTTRVKLDGIWPFSNYRVIWGIRVMKLLGLLIQAGVRDIEALSMIGTYGSAYIRQHTDKMIYAAKVGRNKQAFGIGLLSPVQLIRLSTSRALTDKEFTEALLNAAEQSTTDVKLQNKRAIKAWGFGLYIIFFIFGGLGIGALFKGSMAMMNF